jgi:high-affinity iron transporter
MVAAAIIVFREVLEAALIVGIVMAATTGLPGRSRWIAGGIGGGLAGAILVALFAEVIAAAVAGIGQELFNAVILLLAVAMLGWHNIWMGRHGRALAEDASRLGRAVDSGARPLYALAVAVGAAVLREGSETVLFLWGVAATEGGGSAAMVAGCAVGVLAGVAMGAALYLGLLRIPTRHLFAVTSWLILLLAAGLAAQGAAFLVQADLLPELGAQVWDTSFLLSDTSLPGKVLHTLVGYVAQPSGIQLLFYAATLVVIGGLMRLARLPSGPSAHRLEPAE